MNSTSARWGRRSREGRGGEWRGVEGREGLRYATHFMTTASAIYCNIAI